MKINVIAMFFELANKQTYESEFLKKQFNKIIS